MRNNQSQPSLNDQNQIILLSNDTITTSNDSRRAVEQPRPSPPQIARRGYSAGRYSNRQHGEGGKRPQHVATGRFQGDRLSGKYSRRAPARPEPAGCGADTVRSRVGQEGCRHVRRIATGRSGHRVSYRSDDGRDSHGRERAYHIRHLFARRPSILGTISADVFSHHRRGLANDVPRIGRATHRFCGEPNVRPPSEEHSVEVLFEDPLVVVTGPNNPLARRRRIEISELLDEPWTLQPRENNFGSFAMDALHAAGVAAPRITVATTSSNLRGEMLATGRYLTMVPRYWVLLPRRHPSLRVLPVDFPTTRLKVAIITLKNRSLSRATQLFIDRVRAITKPLAKEK